METLNIALIATGFILIAAELVLSIDSYLDLVLSGIALIVGGFIGVLFQSSTIALVISATLIFSYWFAGRSLIRKWVEPKTHKSNADKLLGTITTVSRLSAHGHKYIIKVDGEEWTCTAAQKLAAGDQVKITAIHGALLEIAPV